MSETDRGALLKNIELLRSSGASVLLLKCLLIAGLPDEARRVSLELAPSEMANATRGSSGLKMSDWAEIQLRAIFCNSVAGYLHNARVLSRTMIDAISSDSRDRASIAPGILVQAAVAAILVGDDDSLAAARRLIDPPAGFAARLLKCWTSQNAMECRSVLNELQTFIDVTALPLWADTWHHLLFIRIAERCSHQAT